MTRSGLPDWARWCPAPASPDWTVGIEEEVMLLDSRSWRLAPVIDDVLPSLSPALVEHVSAETNAGALELATGVHIGLVPAMAELTTLRERLCNELARSGLNAGAAGTHPMSTAEDARVSGGARYQLLEASLRGLAHREPTFALHVHVGVPDAELAIDVLGRMRAHVPLLLALSANSPFVGRRDTGFASARTPLFQAFPRAGIPRRFDSYADWIGAVAPIVDAGAVPEPTFFWWDVRPQPRFGTVEIRVMDAQSSLDDVAALVALTRSLVVAEATDRFAPETLLDAPEVLDENRFLAARDGMDAEFIDPRTSTRVPARVLAEELVDGLRDHASRLGCLDELLGVLRLADDPPAERQRLAADALGLAGAVAALSHAFCASGVPAERGEADDERAEDDGHRRHPLAWS